MKTTPIDQEKREKRQDGWQLSAVLSQYAQHQFQTTLPQFATASLSADSPLNNMKEVGFINSNDFVTARYNPADINTPSAGLELPDLSGIKKSEMSVAPPENNLEPLSRLQIQGVLAAPKLGEKAAQVQDIVQEASQTYDVPVALINAVIRQESAFNPQAQSHAGATGLMQLMPATAKAYGCTDSCDPRQNVMAGTRFLSDLLKMYKGDIELSLAGYNAGPGNVAKYGNQVPPFRETRDYVVKVRGFYESNLASSESGSVKFAQQALEAPLPASNTRKS